MTTTSATSAGPYSVEDLLKRSALAAASKPSAGASKIEQMLAGRDTDTVEISGVQKLINATAKKAAATKEPYNEQEWFLNMKKGQLQMQLMIYSNMGGEVANNMMDAIEGEIRDILTKQQAKLKKVTAEAEAKQKELDAAKAKEYKGLSAEDMLAKANGTYKPTTDAAVQKLLDASKSKVDTTA